MRVFPPSVILDPSCNVTVRFSPIDVAKTFAGASQGARIGFKAIAATTPQDSTIAAAIARGARERRGARHVLNGVDAS
jgi:hypothetical protein